MFIEDTYVRDIPKFPNIDTHSICTNLAWLDSVPKPFIMEDYNPYPAVSPSPT